METFISKQASFNKTCRNCYDRHHLQLKLEKLKNFHETTEDENCAFNSAKPSDIKRRHSQDNLIELRIIVYFATKKTQSII